MSKESVKGAAQKAVGGAKDAVGKVTGNDKLRAEGAADKAIGSAKEAVGKIKDQAKKKR